MPAKKKTKLKSDAPPKGAIDVHTLLKRMARGDPQATRQWKQFRDSVFLPSFEQRPNKLATLGTRVVAAYARVAGTKVPEPRNLTDLIRLAGETLVAREELSWDDICKMPAEDVVTRAIGKLAPDTQPDARDAPSFQEANGGLVNSDARDAPSFQEATGALVNSDARDATWFQDATNKLLKPDTLRHAVQRKGLPRAGRGLFRVGDVCKAFPQHEYLIVAAFKRELSGSNGNDRDV